MRIVLTGATSFIGRAALDILTEEGHQVLAVVRPGSPGRAGLEKLAGCESGAGQEKLTGREGRAGQEKLAGCEGGAGQEKLAGREGGAEQEKLAGREGGAGQEKLADRDDQPPRASRPAFPASGPGIEILDCALADISTLKTHPALRDGADGWLHLGWEGAGSANRLDAQVQHRNIGYALASLETAAAVGCGRFLFSGSQAEYGICRDVMREDMECRPVSEYGKDKLQVCRRAASLADRLGIGYIHTRIFSVYGPGDHPWSLVETCLAAFLNGEHIDLGACTQQWNYLYITDTAMALAQLLLGKAAPGVYNVAGEDTRPLKEYIEEIHRLCGGTGTYSYGKRPPNAEGVVSLRPDISKLKAGTGWESRVDFNTGISSMIADGHRRIKGERKS